MALGLDQVHYAHVCIALPEEHCACFNGRSQCRSVVIALHTVPCLDAAAPKLRLVSAVQQHRPSTLQTLLAYKAQETTHLSPAADFLQLPKAPAAFTSRQSKAGKQLWADISEDPAEESDGVSDSSARAAAAKPDTAASSARGAAPRGRNRGNTRKKRPALRMSECLAHLSNYDQNRVLRCAKLACLGHDRLETLKMFLQQFGTVTEIKHVCKVKDEEGLVESSARLVFVVMASAAEAAAVPKGEEVQIFPGADVSIRPFQIVRAASAADVDISS